MCETSVLMKQVQCQKGTILLQVCKVFKMAFRLQCIFIFLDISNSFTPQEVKHEAMQVDNKNMKLLNCHQKKI